MKHSRRTIYNFLTPNNQLAFNYQSEKKNSCDTYTLRKKSYVKRINDFYDKIIRNPKVP